MKMSREASERERVSETERDFDLIQDIPEQVQVRMRGSD